MNTGFTDNSLICFEGDAIFCVSTWSEHRNNDEMLKKEEVLQKLFKLDYSNQII